MGFILFLDFNRGCFGFFGWTEREENWEQAKTKKSLSFLFGVSRVFVKKRREAKRIRGEGFSFFFPVTVHLVRKEIYVYFYFCQVHIKGNSWMCKKGILKLKYMSFSFGTNLCIFFAFLSLAFLSVGL